MKIAIHSLHFNADAKLLELIQKKMDKLEVFYDRIIDAEIFLRLNNAGAENKTVEIKLNIPTTQLFVKEQDRTFEAALDTAQEALASQLKKFKEKRQTLNRKM